VFRVVVDDIFAVGQELRARQYFPRCVVLFRLRFLTRREADKLVVLLELRHPDAAPSVNIGEASVREDDKEANN
jgi:hypothetical protein